LITAIYYSIQLELATNLISAERRNNLFIEERQKLLEFAYAGTADFNVGETGPSMWVRKHALIIRPPSKFSSETGRMESNKCRFILRWELEKAKGL
jgi:hypothetical protein